MRASSPWFVACLMISSACARAPDAGGVGPKSPPGSRATVEDAGGEGASTSRAGERAGAERGPDRVYELEGMRIAVAGRDARGEPELVAYDAQTVLDQGNDALARGAPEVARARYEKLLAEFPGSRLVPAATYNLGLAAEAEGEPDRAIGYYRRLASDEGAGRDAVDAHMRIAAVQAEIERWADARSTLEAVLARADLRARDRVEARARLGYVALEQGDVAAAEVALREALAGREAMTEPLEDEYFAAMSRYYLAEIPHRQLLARPMRLPDAQLRRDLDAKAELLALAYDRYVDVLDLDEPYWATAAGYQMSQIYKDLWDDVVAAPIPSQLAPEAAGYYIEELRARVRSLLEKALAGHLRNVELAGVYQTSTEWSEASRRRADEIAAILAGTGAASPAPPSPSRGEGAPSADVGAGEEAQRGYVPARIEL